MAARSNRQRTATRQIRIGARRHHLLANLEIRGCPVDSESRRISGKGVIDRPAMGPRGHPACTSLFFQRSLGCWPA